MGRIEVRRMTGLNTSPAAAIVKRFESLLGDGNREELAEKLEALPAEKLTKEELVFVELVKTGSRRKSLARLMAEAGVKPSNVLKHYAEGALALGKIEAAIEVSRNQPKLVKDLLRNALDKELVCQVCVGTGTVKQKTTSKEESVECPGCKGDGFRIRSSKHKTYAMDRVLELGKLKEKGAPGVQVSQTTQVGVNVGRTDGFMERMLKTSDEVLYGRKNDVIEAEARVLEEADKPDSE
jgi:Zn finger protein HypA/HybF involved in hydrogenase expression